MKQKKILAAGIAAAMVLAGLPAGMNAEAAVEIPDPIKTFEFEEGLDGSSTCSAGRGQYSGEVTYTEGHGGGQAVALNGYALNLNQPGLGEDHTISLWVQRTGTPGGNSSLVFMGAPAGETENWVSFSWVTSPGNMQVWTNGDGFGWTPAIQNVDFPEDEWMMVTLSQQGNDLDLYINGELAGSGRAARSLAGATGDICIGATNWAADSTYPAVVDEIAIYDEALDEDQVYLLYDPDPDVDQILGEKGISVPDNLALFEGDTAQISVDLPAGVQEEDVTLSYSSEDDAIAEVDDQGVVTGVASGNTTVTVTAETDSGTQVSDTVEIRVLDRLNDENIVVSYTMDDISGDQIQDASGLGNNAVIRNSGDVQAVSDGDRSVIELTGQGYVELPKSLYNDLTDKEAFTIEVTYARSATSGVNAWLYCFGSNVQSWGDNYLFFCPNFGNTIRSGIKYAGNEQLFTTTVSQAVDEYYTVDMVFDHGVITMYQDGIEVGTALNTGFSMENIVNNGTVGDVLGFIGRSCFSGDGYFNGKVDAFKIYNKAMNPSEIQLSNPDYLKGLQAELDAFITEDTFLSERNPSMDEITYDMELPSVMGDLDIVWTSDPEGVITQDGSVFNGEEDQPVTLTASVTSGVLTASKSFDFTVKALDLTALNETLEQAQNIDRELYTEDSVTDYFNIVNAITTDDVRSQTEAEEKIAEINHALSFLRYKENYDDPWDIVNAAAPKEDVFCEAGDTETLFTVPEEIADAVIVTYSSDNEEVAVYEDGVMTALADGTALLTVRVEAKSDGYALEFATVVTVGEEPGGEEPGGEEPGGQEPGGEEPGGQEPGGEEPGGEEPGGQEPGGEEPGGEEPGGEEPGGQEPGGEEPGGQEPGGEEPGGEEPGGEEPGGQNPDGQKPGTETPQQPDGSNQNTGSALQPDGGSDSETPQTGDTSDIFPFAGMAAAALAVSAAALKYRRKDTAD